MIESYIKSAIEKEKRGDTRDIACLMLVALNKHYITRSELYNKFGKLRWPKKNAMDTILDYFIEPHSDLVSKYNCKYNNILKHIKPIDSTLISQPEITYKCDILKAEEFAMTKFPRETLQIISLIEGQPIHVSHPPTTKPTPPDLIATACDSLKATLLSKNDRYGNSSLDPINIFSLERESKIEARISDKLSRMKSMQHDKHSKDYLDAILDCTGYLILYHIALNEENR